MRKQHASAFLRSTTVKITVTHTPYEGDDFPESVHYSDYVVTALAGRYQGLGLDVEIEVSEGPTTKVSIDGETDPEKRRQMAEDIETAVKVDLWDAFCADGYTLYEPSVSR
jgi:hypothetical protein